MTVVMVMMMVYPNAPSFCRFKKLKKFIDLGFGGGEIEGKSPFKTQFLKGLHYQFSTPRRRKLTLVLPSPSHPPMGGVSSSLSACAVPSFSSNSSENEGEIAHTLSAFAKGASSALQNCGTNVQPYVKSARNKGEKIIVLFDSDDSNSEKDNDNETLR